MPEFSNKQNLLEPIFKALTHDSYSAGGSDLTPSTWIDSPQIAVLKKKHADEIEEDASDRLFSCLGTGVHSMMEAGAGERCIVEERLFYDHPDGLKLSGELDMQILKEDGTVIIVDHKVTSVWTYILSKDHGGVKPEWISQLNSYAYLVRKVKDIEVSELFICAVFRDWRASDASAKPDYPPHPIMQLSVPLWDREQGEEYVEGRLKAHEAAGIADFVGDTLSPCTPDEMWARPGTFAVKKSSKHKRAIKVLSSREEAEEYCGNNSMDAEDCIEVRHGKRIRCEEDYCRVARFCQQYKQYLEENNGGL